MADEEILSLLGKRIRHLRILSACLFNRVGRWEFLHIAIDNLTARNEDSSCLKVMHPVPETPEPPWHGSILAAIEDRRR
jgi:hypothetical protein